MIPDFPNFKSLELDDQKFIEDFIKQFPPYCDYEFIGLWTYNPGDKTTISILNNNFIVRRPDYINEDFFYYSFLGTNNIRDTITKLLQKGKEEHLYPQLKLIPEISITSSPNLQEYFSVKEDPDNFDYIFSVDEMANLEGSKYSDRRNHINKFKRSYTDCTVQIIDLTKEKTKQAIIELFILWEKQKGKNRNETVIELTALEKLFDLVNMLDIGCLGIYFQNQLIGFTTLHLSQNDYAMLNFIKADISYRGIYEYFNHEIAKHLKTLGYIYLNYEQDLGIPGLREAKSRLKPAFYLKKYIVEEL